jgi:hypothetical protein
MTVTGKNRIMIFGPKDDGTYVVEFRTAAGEALRFRSRAARRRFAHGLCDPISYTPAAVETRVAAASASSERQRLAIVLLVQATPTAADIRSVVSLHE